jgi:uncharacterized protein DUF1761
MTFSGVNYVAVVIAALAGFGLGAVWYMVLGGVWLRAIGKTKGDFQYGSGAAKALPFIISIIALLIMATILAGIMGHIGSVTIRGGVITGALVWLGFVITTLGVDHAFSGARPMLTLIDGGHWLAVLLIQGAVIGAFGV